MKLADISRRQMAVIYVIGLVLSLALLYKFVFSPEFERYRTFRARYSSQQQRKMRAVIQRDALLEEYLELRAKADRMQKLLLNRVEADDFQEQLPRLSRQTGNDLRSITPQDSKLLAPKDPKDPEANEDSPLSEIAQMPIAVTIKGKYGNIIKLFNTLESFKELMVVSNVTVTSARDSITEVQTRFSLNLIHTLTDMRESPDDVLVDVASMDQAAEVTEVAPEIAQKKDVQPPKRPAKPPELVKATKEKAAARQKETTAVEKNIKYAVQVGAFNIAENSKSLAELLESRNYEPWVRPNLVTGQAPHYVLVGKFATKPEADEFGKLMRKELPWVNEYVIKKTVLDLDTVLREASNL